MKAQSKCLSVYIRYSQAESREQKIRTRWLKVKHDTGSPKRHCVCVCLCGKVSPRGLPSNLVSFTANTRHHLPDFICAVKNPKMTYRASQLSAHRPHLNAKVRHFIGLNRCRSQLFCSLLFAYFHVLDTRVSCKSILTNRYAVQEISLATDWCWYVTPHINCSGVTMQLL